MGEWGGANESLKDDRQRIGRWSDAEGNPDWDAYAGEIQEVVLARLADQFWITLADDGIHFINSPEGCSPAQAREFAKALNAAAHLYEHGSLDPVRAWVNSLT